MSTITTHRIPRPDRRRTLLLAPLLGLVLGLLAGPIVAVPATAQSDPTDPAEELYYDARDLLRDGAYRDAIGLFERLDRQYPDGEYAARALYWRAFALQREGGRRNLREASRVLEDQFERFPAEARRGDSAELAIRIQGDLAELGDAEAAASIAALADEIRGRDAADDDGDTGRDDNPLPDEMRIAALNALMQMAPERALPILRKLLVEEPERYDASLREKAVFIVSQHGDELDAFEMLEHVIDEDPSPAVREQAVFWLSQTGDERAVDLLVDIARRDGETAEIRDKAIFALSQFGGRRAAQVLREIALDTTTPDELREKAIFWIGQSDDDEAAEFLIQLYGQLEDGEMRDKAIFGIAQSGDAEASEFLLSVVRDTTQDIDNRKQALFWLGQAGEIDVDSLVEIFDSVDDREMQEQAVFVLSQKGGRDAIAALIEIARTASDQEIREKAIFWLGQSDDDEAAEFLADLIAEEF